MKQFLHDYLFDIISDCNLCREISILTLNLHGLHPTGEERRIIEEYNGKKSLSWSHLHYFTPEELARGHERRQALLAQDLEKLSPDIAFFQEVGGGAIDREKSCSAFEQSNSVSDLSSRINGQKVWTACRENIGWWTNIDTFTDFQIVSETSNELIFRRGDNPYPHGVIMEGLGILTGPSINVQDHFTRHITINHLGEKFFFQGLRFGLKEKSKDWWIAINIHGGHKIQHFEQAVATRLFLTDYIMRQKDRDSFKGFIIAGDFNAQEPVTEVTTVPWSFHHRWQTRENLKQKLMAFNRSSQKPFATLPEKEASYRSDEAISKLYFWFSLNRNINDGSLIEVSEPGPCSFPFKSFNPQCRWKEKIDHIFVSENIKVLNFSGIYKQNNWTDLAHTLSDHPGLWARIEL